MQSEVILFGRPDSWQIYQVGKSHQPLWVTGCFQPTHSELTWWVEIISSDAFTCQLKWFGTFFSARLSSLSAKGLFSGNVSQESHHKHDFASRAWGQPAQVTSWVFIPLITWKQSGLLVIIIYLLIIPLRVESDEVPCNCLVSLSQAAAPTREGVNDIEASFKDLEIPRWVIWREAWVAAENNSWRVNEKQTRNVLPDSWYVKEKTESNWKWGLSGV